MLSNIGMDFLRLIMFGIQVHSDSWICRFMYFVKFGNFSAITSLSSFPALSISSSPFQVPKTWVWLLLLQPTVYPFPVAAVTSCHKCGVSHIHSLSALEARVRNHFTGSFWKLQRTVHSLACRQYSDSHPFVPSLRPVLAGSSPTAFLFQGCCGYIRAHLDSLCYPQDL